MLEHAYKAYGACAKSITNGLGARNPNQTESELIIAFWIVVDWCRRASALKPLEYEKHTGSGLTFYTRCSKSRLKD